MLWSVYQAEKEYVDIIEAVYPNYELYLELLNFFQWIKSRYQKCKISKMIIFYNKHHLPVLQTLRVSHHDYFLQVSLTE